MTGFSRTLSDCQPVWTTDSVNSISDTSSALYCIEVPRLTPPPPTEPPAPYVLLLWLNLLMDDSKAERFGI